MDKDYQTIATGRIPAFARILVLPVFFAAAFGSLVIHGGAEDAATLASSVVPSTAKSSSVAVTAAAVLSSSLTSAPLLGRTDLVYQGAFRLPQGAVGASSFDYAGSALAFNPAQGSLFMVGHTWQQLVAEVAVPEIRRSTRLSDLAVAPVLQTFADPTDGRLRSVEDDQSQPVSVSGLLPYRGQLYLAGSVFYDGNGSQRLSHFISGLDLSVQGDVRGPFEVGTLGAGYVSGYFGLIPDAWQSALGGPVLNGNCCLSIISRTSYGPSAFAIDPTQLETTSPLPAAPLVYYTGAHPLGPYGGESALFNGSTVVTGVVFPENTRSVLFVGRQGLGAFCYGTGTDNPALAGTLAEPGDYYCYDPTAPGKGGHAYPYAYYVWAYDALDLAAVKSGAVQPWDVKPYAVWSLDLPFAGGAYILGAAYDAQSGRIFVSQGKGDGNNPLIHVFSLGPGSTLPQAPVVNMVSPKNGATFAPLAPIRVSATALNADGSPSSVKLYVNGGLVGTGASPYSVDLTDVVAGSYSLKAIATDSLGTSTTSGVVSITVKAASDPVNVALATNGATALASSTYDSGSMPSAAISGDRQGQSWGTGGGWNDGTRDTFPDWLEIDFNGTKTINEVDIFSLQDNYTAPSDPTPTMTFSRYGLTDFQVQYWTGTQWLTVPGGTVSGNNLVWRQINFSPLATSRIRVWITGALNAWSRVVEVEAYQPGVSNAVPTVSLTSPANNATFNAPGSITVTADAADSDGTVSSVSFFVNGALIATDISSPYSVNWSGVAAGTYQLTAVATDNAGLNATSSAVTVVVRQPSPPLVSLVTPANGVTFAPLTAIPVSATASDADGTVSAVAFYANSTLIGIVTSSPYSMAWTGAAAGTYQLTAVATDNTGLTATSSAVTIVVRQPSPPLVSLVSPVDGATLVPLTTITVTAAASDSDGTVSAVAFYANGVAIGMDTSSPYSIDWSGAALGTYQLTAVVTDSAGLTATSIVATVIVGRPSQTLRTIQVPTTPSVSSGTARELGTRIVSDVSGQMTAIRFWKSSDENGPHTGRVWSAAGAMLVAVTFTDETGSGWQQQSLPTPLSLLANIGYVVSVNSGPNGYLATTVDAFATGLVNMHLQAAAGAGRQASAGVFPSLGATDDYFRDMVFVADEDGGDTTAPTVSIAQPAANSIVFGKVALAATAWDDVGVVGVQFQVDGVNIGAEVNAAPYAITWDSAGVANGSRILTVIVRDAAGHSALASKTVTVANVSASQTLMTTQVPQTTSYSFGKGTWEAGMRIVSDVSGQMTAIRFWKSPRDTGPHTGHIWSATGQMLASVTFKNETSSGWQQQSLPTSVSVLANAVYVVSVSEGSNGGSTAYVALSSSGFATALVNGHLRAPAGNSGLYGKSGVLPASGSSNNYFRDVVFVADGGR